MIYRRLVRPVLFRAYGGDAERVHEQTLRWLSGLGAVGPARSLTGALLARHRHPVSVAGIDFAAPVGVAAGLDKNGLAVRSWAALGFGFAELGTVTARAQPGNDRPRLFRLPQSRAIVNRMGFNNAGAAALAQRLEAAGVRRGNGAVGMPVGISIGKSKVTPLDEAAEDYLASLRLLTPYADYVAVNVSSPNTPGLRALQDADSLTALLRSLTAEAARLAGGRRPRTGVRQAGARPDRRGARAGRRRGRAVRCRRSDRHQHHPVAGPGSTRARRSEPPRPGDCPVLR